MQINQLCLGDKQKRCRNIAKTWSRGSFAEYIHQLPQYSWQEFPDHLLDLCILSTVLLMLLLLLLLLLVVWLLLWLILAVALLLLVSAPVVDIMHVNSTTSQVDIDSSLVWFGVILQSKLLTNLLHTRLDLLYVTRTVITFADNDVQVGLAVGLRVSDALFEDIFSFLNELSVKINGIGRHSTICIVFPEDEF